MNDNYCALIVAILWYKFIPCEFANVILNEKYSNLIIKTRSEKLTSSEKKYIRDSLRKNKPRSWTTFENKFRISRYEIWNQLKVKDY